MSQSAEIIEGSAEQGMVVQSSPAPGGVGMWGTDDPMAIVERATATSRALMQVVHDQKLSVSIGGKPYLLVEAWTLLGSMVRVFPVTVWTRPIKEGTRVTGYEARVEARTIEGAVVGAAETMCSRDEERWKDADEHALKSMAQTRGVSKALASPLRFIAVLAGFAGTPAEEMQGVTPRGRTASQRPSQDTTDKPLCAECKASGIKSKNGYPPKIWLGKTTCDGVIDGTYVNHPRPGLADDELATDDPTDIPM